MVIYSDREHYACLKMYLEINTVSIVMKAEFSIILCNKLEVAKL
jgi:hypothetical protein